MAEDQFDSEITTAARPKLTDQGQPASAHRPQAPAAGFTGLEFSAIQFGSGISGQQKTTLMETVPSPHVGLNKPGFKHTLLAFCHLRAPHFSLIASGRTSPCLLQWHFTSIHFDGQVCRGSWQMPVSLQTQQLCTNFKEKINMHEWPRHDLFKSDLNCWKNEWKNMQVVTGSCSPPFSVCDFFFLIEDERNNCSVTEAFSHGKHLLYFSS